VAQCKGSVHSGCPESIQPSWNIIDENKRTRVDCVGGRVRRLSAKEGAGLRAGAASLEFKLRAAAQDPRAALIVKRAGESRHSALLSLPRRDLEAAAESRRAVAPPVFWRN
jgi:hypothetical protein